MLHNSARPLSSYVRILVSCYGSFSDEKIWREAIEFFLRSTRERAVPWDVKLTVEKISQSYEANFGERRDLVRLSHVFYQSYAQAKGYSTYLCKDIWLHDFVDEIAEALPEAKFIHIVRDPRDVCASQKERPFGKQNVWALSRDWKHQCDAALRLSKRPSLSKRFHRITYERLISALNDTVSDLLSDMEVEVRWSNEGGEIPAHFHEWKNLSKPVMTNNSGKYTATLSGTEVAIIEYVTWNTMSMLGYQPEAEMRPKPSTWSRIGYPKMAAMRYSLRRLLNRSRLLLEPINRQATAKLVCELEERFR